MNNYQKLTGDQVVQRYNLRLQGRYPYPFDKAEWDTYFIHKKFVPYTITTYQSFELIGKKPVSSVFIGKIVGLLADPGKIMFQVVEVGEDNYVRNNYVRNGKRIVFDDKDKSENLVPTEALVDVMGYNTYMYGYKSLTVRVVLSEYEFLPFTLHHKQKIITHNKDINPYAFIGDNETYDFDESRQKILFDLFPGLSTWFTSPEAGLVQTSRFLTASYPQGPQLQTTNLPIIASFLGLRDLGRQLYEEEAPAPGSSRQGTLLQQRSETGYVIEPDEVERNRQIERDRELQRTLRNS
jgi:hypothetical protein